MAIIINIDVMLAKRKMSVTELSEKVGITMANLSILKNGDQYGYELANRLSEMIQISDGTVYPILRKLAVDGMVTTYLQESQSGPPRKYYRLTSQGQTSLIDMRREWSSFAESVNKIVGGAFS